MQEIWKDITGYEGLYQISNYGNVKSLIKWNGHHYVKGERILKQSLSTTGYYKVELTKNKQKRSCKIHRLVATAFIPNVHNKPYINHIDGNRSNNNANNLEWCTQTENLIHAVELGLIYSKRINEADLRNLCLVERKTCKEIAQIFNTTRTVIRHNMKKYGIKSCIPKGRQSKHQTTEISI